MTRFGYHASHEQHTPSALLEYVRSAESAGFELGMCSDHFHPWLESQGESGFAWSWLGAALQATGLSFGTVNAPGYRYHPAIVAQAAATLAAMYPGRFWIATGSGEALNERITGGVWPAKPERNEKLLECIDVMRALWAGETVTHHGLITVEEAKLYTRPEEPPLIFGAALSAETAEWMGSWADGLITVGGGRVAKLIDAFRAGGGEGKPVRIQACLCWAPDEAEARRMAYEQWRANLFSSDVLATLRSPAEFEAAARFISLEEVADQLVASGDLRVHIEALRQYVELGVDAVYLFNVGTNQAEFIDVFGAQVLPELRG